MAIINNNNNNKVDKDVEKLEPMCIADVNIRWKKLNIELLHGPVISLLSIFPKELKAGTLTDIRGPVFVAVLITIAER